MTLRHYSLLGGKCSGTGQHRSVRCLCSVCRRTYCRTSSRQLSLSCCLLRVVFFILIFVFLSSFLDFLCLVCGAGFTLGTQNRLLRITRPNWPSRSYQLLVSNRYVELWRCTQVQFFKAAPKSWRMKRTNSKKLERKGMKLTDGANENISAIFCQISSAKCV